MEKILMLLVLFGGGLISKASAQSPFDFSTVTSKGELKIHVLGHASLLFEWNGLSIYVDPNSRINDFSTSEDADVILVTHEHEDHFDATALNQIKTDSTMMVYTSACRATGKYNGVDTVMANGDSISLMGFSIEAIPAYNIVRPRHVKDIGNGYILTFADKRVYVAGDTEVLEEMNTIHDIAIAFFGYSKYNMDDAMFVDAIKVITPPIVVPYHYDNSSIASLIAAVAPLQGVTLLTNSPATSSGSIATKEGRFIFPNPVKDIVYLSNFKDGSVVLIKNSNGQLVKKVKVSSMGKIDVSGLLPGTYIIETESDGIKEARRFVVIH